MFYYFDDESLIFAQNWADFFGFGEFYGGFSICLDWKMLTGPQSYGIKDDPLSNEKIKQLFELLNFKQFWRRLLKGSISIFWTSKMEGNPLRLDLFLFPIPWFYPRTARPRATLFVLNFHYNKSNIFTARKYVMYNYFFQQKIINAQSLRSFFFIWIISYSSHW